VGQALAPLGTQGALCQEREWTGEGYSVTFPHVRCAQQQQYACCCHHHACINICGVNGYAYGWFSWLLMVWGIAAWRRVQGGVSGPCCLGVRLASLLLRKFPRTSSARDWSSCKALLCLGGIIPAIMQESLTTHGQTGHFTLVLLWQGPRVM